MVKTCNGCRALTHTPSTQRCQLGFAIKPKKTVLEVVTEFQPVNEGCPKPKTLDKLSQELFFRGR